MRYALINLQNLIFFPAKVAMDYARYNIRYVATVLSITLYIYIVNHLINDTKTNILPKLMIL